MSRADSKSGRPGMHTDELAGFSIFAGLSPRQLAELAPIFWREQRAAGDHVFAQGDEALNIYIVVSGEIGLRFFPYDGGHLDIETIWPGGVFGWSAALGRPQYTSAAVCNTPVELIATRGADLRRLMRRDKQLGVLLLDRMAQIVAHRLESFRAQLVALLNVEAETDRPNPR